MWWLLGKLSCDLLHSQPPSLRVDLLSFRWAWKASACAGMGRAEMEEMQQWCLTVCWTNQSQLLQLFLLIFTCTANEAFAHSGAAINLCTTCFCFLQSLKLPLSYHPLQVQSISTLIYEMSCQGVHLANYFIVFIALKSCTWNIKKKRKYFASNIITMLLDSLMKIKMAYSTTESEKKIIWPYGVISTHRVWNKEKLFLIDMTKSKDILPQSDDFFEEDALYPRNNISMTWCGSYHGN